MSLVVIIHSEDKHQSILAPWPPLGSNLVGSGLTSLPYLPSQSHIHTVSALRVLLISMNGKRKTIQLKKKDPFSVMLQSQL